MQNLNNYKEIETKYQIKNNKVKFFKKLVSSFPNLLEYKYVESDDIYYKNSCGEFLRYRKPDKLGSDPKAELTKKTKINKNNNIYRLEVNLDVTNNKKNTVYAFMEILGFVYDFKITKHSHIYVFPDVTIPLYSVIDSKSKVKHFVEIEVNESLASTLTSEECWEIIIKYEKMLSPLGIKPQNRLKKSLLEIYKNKRV